MTTDPIANDPIDRPVAPVTGPAASDAPAPHAGADDSPTFRALLDSLQRLVRERPQPPAVQDADTLRSAMQKAEDGFQQVMDLRRRLEEAFRARGQ